MIVDTDTHSQWQRNKNLSMSGTPTRILSLFSVQTLTKVQHLRGPFEVQSPSEPLNWGQGGQQQIWFPQQLETSSVWGVSGDRFPSREMMLKRQCGLRVSQSISASPNPSLSISVKQDSFFICPGIFTSTSSLSLIFSPSNTPSLSDFLL